MKNWVKHSIVFAIIGMVAITLGIYLDAGIKPGNLAHKEEGYHLSIIEHASEGWSYEVYHASSLKIKQEYIPGVPGNKRFSTKQKAEKIGTLVLIRLIEGQSPTITREDLQKHAIAY